MKTKTVNMIIALLLILLPAVGALQFYWITKLSSEHQSVLLHNIENSTGLVMDDLAQLLMRVHRHFTSIKRDNFNELSTELAHKLTSSKNMDFASYVKEIYISEINKPQFFKLDETTQKFIPAYDFKFADYVLKISDNKLGTGIKSNDNNSLKANMQLMTFTIEADGKNYIVSMCLDRKFFKQSCEKAFKRYFANNQDYQVDIKIVNAQSLELVHSTNSNEKGKVDTNGALARYSLGFLPPSMSMKPGATPPPPNEQMKAKDRSSHSHFGQRRFLPNSPYLIIAQSRDNSVENFLGKYRFQNYALSAISIVALLLTFTLLIFAFKKNERTANERIGFIAGISHEFRTPLAVIRAASENIKDGVINNPEKMKSYGILIYDEIDKLWQMVEQSLAMVGVRSAAPRGNTDKIDVGNFLGELCENYYSECSAKRLNLEYIQGEKVNVKADSQALSSVFSNIITNAIKYNKPNGKISVQYNVDNNKRKLIVSISDTGIGIKRTELSEVFKPFFRAETATNSGVPGSGIGLALVKAQVDRLGGKVKIKSTLNVGTNVTIILPVDYDKK